MSEEQAERAKVLARRDPARALHEAGVERAGLLPAELRAGGGRTVLRVGHHGGRPRPGHHLLRIGRPGAVAAERPWHRRPRARPGPQHARRGGRGPPALRRAARVPGLAPVLPARPGGLAGRGLPRPQGALVDPRCLGRRQPVVGRLRLPHEPAPRAKRGRPPGVGARPGCSSRRTTSTRSDRTSSTASPSSFSAPSSSSRRPGSCGASSTSTAC